MPSLSADQTEAALMLRDHGNSVRKPLARIAHLFYYFFNQNNKINAHWLHSIGF